MTKDPEFPLTNDARLAVRELAKARLAEEEAAFWRGVDKGKALDRAGCTWSNYEDKSDETPSED